jgi:hypothetical protein
MMKNRTIHHHVCLNRDDEPFLEEAMLEELLDVEERKGVPLRTANLRKSIEHYAERRRLRRYIVDFDFPDEHDEH